MLTLGQTAKAELLFSYVSALKNSWMLWFIPIIIFIKALEDSSGQSAGIILVEYGLLAGLAAIAIAIYLSAGNPIRDFLKEIKRGAVDEKIAILYGHTIDVEKWYNEPKEKRERYVKKISSDLRAIGKVVPQIRKSIEPERRPFQKLSNGKFPGSPSVTFCFISRTSLE